MCRECFKYLWIHSYSFRLSSTITVLYFYRLRLRLCFQNFKILNVNIPPWLGRIYRLMKSQLLENAFSIKNLLCAPRQKSPPDPYHYKEEESYTLEAMFFRKSILICRKGAQNHGLRNYCKGTTIRKSC